MVVCSPSALTDTRALLSPPQDELGSVTSFGNPSPGKTFWDQPRRAEGGKTPLTQRELFLAARLSKRLSLPFVSSLPN